MEAQLNAAPAWIQALVGLGLTVPAILIGLGLGQLTWWINQRKAGR